jgi:hypothetical protein
LVVERWLVFALSLGSSAVRALLSLLADLVTGVPLGHSYVPAGMARVHGGGEQLLKSPRLSSGDRRP